MLAKGGDEINGPDGGKPEERPSPPIDTRPAEALPPGTAEAIGAGMPEKDLGNINQQAIEPPKELPPDDTAMLAQGGNEIVAHPAEPSPPADVAGVTTAVTDADQRATNYVPPVPGLPTTELNTITNGLVDQQQVKVDGLQTDTDQHQGFLDLLRDMRARGQQNNLPSADLQQIETAISEVTGEHDGMVRTLDGERRILDVMQPQGDRLNFGEAIPGDEQASVERQGGANQAFEDFNALLPKDSPLSPKPREFLSPEQRLGLSEEGGDDSLRARYDRYVLAQREADVAITQLDSRYAHTLQGAAHVQSFVDNPDYTDAVTATGNAFDHALEPILKPKGLQVNMPAPQLSGQVEETDKSVNLADGAWDLSRSYRDGAQPDAVAAEQTLITAPRNEDGTLQTQEGQEAANALQPISNSINVKGNYLQSQVSNNAVEQARENVENSERALLDGLQNPGAEPQRTELLGAAGADKLQLQLLEEQSTANNTAFRAALAQETFTHAQGDGRSTPQQLSDLQEATNTLVLQANEQDTLATMHALQPEADVIQAQLAGEARAPTGDIRLISSDSNLSGASTLPDPRLVRLGEHGMAKQAYEAALGARLRNDFRMGLSPELRDPQTEQQGMDFATARYEFMQQNPDALKGLDSNVAAEFEKDPNEGARTEGFVRAGSGVLQTVGGGLEVAASSPTVAGTIPGWLLIGHGLHDLGWGLYDGISGERHVAPVQGALEDTGASLGVARAGQLAFDGGTMGPAVVRGIGGKLPSSITTTGGAAAYRGFAGVNAAVLLDDAQSRGHTVADGEHHTPFTVQGIMATTGLSERDANFALMAGLTAHPAYTTVRTGVNYLHPPVSTGMPGAGTTTGPTGTTGTGPTGTGPTGTGTNGTGTNGTGTNSTGPTGTGPTGTSTNGTGTNGTGTNGTGTNGTGIPSGSGPFGATDPRTAASQ
ncbi:MAG: hypothetical protein ACRDTD_15295, partial [Pseudonocardiaceae bacterium]